MYTEYTYQDWLKMGGGDNALHIVQSYKASADFRAALEAGEYFSGHNPTLDDKWLMQIDKATVKDENGIERTQPRPVKIAGNRVSSNFFSRFVIQQNQFLLGNGVTLKNDAQKERLGAGFDATLAELGEAALVQGVAYGYWNADHMEPIRAARDALSGCVALPDERTGEIGAAIQFWQINGDRPLYMRLFEPDGVTVYMRGKDGRVAEAEPKRAYKITVRRDALGVAIEGAENYARLPIIPLYANGAHTSELTNSIKSKIDAYDRILSDFGDNLERANDVYWVLNNFGGSTAQALETIQEIQKLKVALSYSDGVGSASAEPRTIEVPYAARQAALDILKRELYSDYMALDMDELTGGSLTNVAIETACANLNLKADRYEWQAFRFVQKILALNGIETEEITFKRRSIANRSEIIQDIYAASGDLDQETRLKLNPYILQEEIPKIMQNTEAERVSGLASVQALQDRMDSMSGGEQT